MTASTVEVSAVIVTRGDVDVAPVEDSTRAAGIVDVVVWDNSRRRDLGVYGRYAAIPLCLWDRLYVQDDDCIIDVAKVIEQYEPGVVVANMPQSRWGDYPDSALVGWGAVFDRDLPDRAFERFSCSDAFPETDDDWPHGLFHRECDTVFTALTPHRKIDVGFAHREFAETPGRMFKRPEHREQRDLMLQLARKVRDAVPA